MDEQGTLDSAERAGPPALAGSAAHEHDLAAEEVVHEMMVSLADASVPDEGDDDHYHLSEAELKDLLESAIERFREAIGSWP